MPGSIPDPQENFAELIARVHRRIHAEARVALAPLGLTPAQMRALRIVAGSDEGLRMSALADRLGIARRSATTVVEHLAESHLLERRADGDDGRAVVVTVTPAARELLAATIAQRRRVADALLDPLDATERATLTNTLRTLLDRADPPPCPRRDERPAQ